MVPLVQSPSDDAAWQRIPALPSVPSSKKVGMHTTANAPSGCNGGGDTIAKKEIQEPWHRYVEDIVVLKALSCIYRKRKNSCVS